MTPYYDRLSAERLRSCYELAPPEVHAYLDAEVRHILASIRPGARVLELGCGYGRVLGALVARSGWLAGVDLSLSSLALARRQSLGRSGVALAQMNVAAMAFRPAAFDLICCLRSAVALFLDSDLSDIHTSTPGARDIRPQTSDQRPGTRDRYSFFKFSLQKVVDKLGISLAFGFFHDLPDEIAEQFVFP